MSVAAAERVFVSGNEAVALAVRLARPHVIASYPITPQTTAVERLAEMVEDGSLRAEYLNVESEHSAMSALIGASAVGARTFTATSSQGLLYMAECLHYASGGRFPVVMMNANRSVALPWSIYGDQRDSISLLDSGWIQAYAEDAQESFDLILQAYAVAEHPDVLTPAMVNLDGFHLTHTYEAIEVPGRDAVDAFLPPFDSPNRMCLEKPKNLGFSSRPSDNMEIKHQQHRAMLAAARVIGEVDARFASAFGRRRGGLTESYRTADAEIVLATLGSVTGTARTVVDALREEGVKAGLLKLRFLRPFPEAEVRSVAASVRALGVLEKDISFGYEGTVFTNVASAVAKGSARPLLRNFVAGLGGRDISLEDIAGAFRELAAGSAGGGGKTVRWVNLGVETDV